MYRYIVVPDEPSAMYVTSFLGSRDLCKYLLTEAYGTDMESSVEADTLTAVANCRIPAEALCLSD